MTYGLEARIPFWDKAFLQNLKKKHTWNWHKDFWPGGRVNTVHVAKSPVKYS